jgi:hypothetical protein
LVKNAFGALWFCSLQAKTSASRRPASIIEGLEGPSCSRDLL